MSYIVSFILPYLIGAIPFSYIFVKLFTSKDLRNEGSGNLGARNSFDVGGIKAALLVLILDILKGYLSLTLIAKLYNNSVLLYIAAFAVILGHNFSVYLKLKGGKGLASALGVFAYINMYLLLTLLVIAGVSILITKKSNPSAMIAVIFVPIVFFAYQRDYFSLIAGILISIIVLIKHKKDYPDFISIFKR